jgi:thiamine-monophosphate kinase
MSNSNLTLGDLGEMRLIEEVILPMARCLDLNTLAGDDCAYLPSAGLTLAVTADVGPKPLLHSLPGHENDMEAAGWLAVVATASDVASAGATPFFLTNCIDAPPTMLVDDFKRYLSGYFSACSAFGFSNGGGDVRHGPVLSIRVFGAGQCHHPYKVGRAGARSDERLVAIGPCGVFMATYLLALHQHQGAIVEGLLTPKAAETLRYPKPQLRQMSTLMKCGVLSSSSDTSDGLIGAIDNLSRSSGCGFNLELNDSLLSSEVKAAASAHNVNAWNIFSSWGDWAVVATVSSKNSKVFEELCAQHAIEWTPLGYATADKGKVTATVNDGKICEIAIIRNENFVSRGFNAGLKGHLDYMLNTSLFI